MRAINRQKFLAELAKLLSFMYEEDRQYALDMYERMFDIAEGNEQWLIQNLMSPTRQAVIVARSYDAKERKLSVSAQWKEEDGYEDESEETPPFVLAINKIFDDLFPEEEEEPQEQDENQISFSELAAEGKTDAKKPKMPKAAVLLNRTQEFSAVRETEDPAAGEGTPEANGAEDDYADLLDFDLDDLPDSGNEVKIEYLDRSVFEQASEPPIEEHPESEPEKSETETAEPEATEAEKKPVQKTVDEPVKDRPAETIEEQLESTTLQQTSGKKRRSIEELLGFKKEKSRDKTGITTEDAATAQKEPAPDTEEKTDLKQTDQPPAPPADETGTETEQVQNVPEEPPQAERPAPESKAETAGSAEAEKNQTADKPGQRNRHTDTPYEIPEENVPVIPKPAAVTKPDEVGIAEKAWNVPILVLFLAVAIPLTLLALAVLLIPTALFFSLSIALIALGTVLVVSAFSGFAVLADILLLLGAAVVSMGLGLLFLWLSFWMIGEVMADLVQWVRKLAETCCRKEVPKT